MGAPVRSSAIAVVVAATLCSVAASSVSLAWPFAPARTPPRPVLAGKTVLLVVDRLPYLDLARHSSWQALREQALCALMGTHVLGPCTRQAAHLTLGSGARAAADAEAVCLQSADAAEEGESAGLVWARRTGLRTQRNVLVNVNMPLTQRMQLARHGTAPLGSLARALMMAGQSVTLLSTAATCQEMLAALLLMDEVGRVASWCRWGLHRPDSGAPHGRKANWAALREAVEECCLSTDLLIVEIDDFARLDDLALRWSDDCARRCRHQLLAELADFLRWLCGTIPPSGQVVLCVPTPPAGDVARGWLLTPLFIWTNTGPGLLWSASTRRPGFVLNVDLAPTLAQCTGAPAHNGWVGHPLQWLPSSNPLLVLGQLYRQATTSWQWRPITVRAFVYVCTALLLGLGWAAWRRPSLLLLLLSAVLSWPAWLLVWDRLVTIPPLALVGSLVTTAAWSAMIARQLGKIRTAAAWSSGLLVVLVAVGLAVDPHFTADTTLGPSTCLGARLYGLGNEYGGLLAGSVLLLWAVAIDGGSAVAGAGLLVSAMTLVLVAGVNWGITCALGLACCTLLANGKRLGGRAWAAGAGLTALVAAGVLWGLCQGAVPTHLSGAVRRLIQQDWEWLLAVATRKIGSNMRLLAYAVWNRLSVGLLACGVALWWKTRSSRPASGRCKQHHQRLGRSLTVGAAAALLLNDSGVVAAVCLLMFPVAYMVADKSWPPDAVT